METIEKTFLDVTVLDPREKHPTIFRLFDQLQDGQTLTIKNDHDPKPLYYQLLNERGNIFEWEYTESGPIWWKVNITMRKDQAGQATVGEIAAKDLRKAQVFRKYGIDFCCGGKKTLKEVCSEKGLDEVAIARELQAQDNVRGSRAVAYADWSPDFLADYIVNTHHSYVRKTLPELRAFGRKVAAVHGPNHPELIRISDLIQELSAELKDHLMKEEEILFPYVKDLVRARQDGKPLPVPNFGSIGNPIHIMEDEHESAGGILEEIRRLSGDYTLPAEACASYTLLFNMLQEFEEDLHIHIHLENNILFPKSKELEVSFRDKN
jgi:regulator of cell morphogenesis and NO signaling